MNNFFDQLRENLVGYEAEYFSIAELIFQRNFTDRFKIIIIQGRGGCGKSTLLRFLLKYFGDSSGYLDLNRLRLADR